MKGLFKYLKKKEYEKLLGIMKEIKAKPGKVIVEEGSTKREMFYIVSGEAEVISEKAGEPLVLATLGEGSFFGEIGLFLRVPRTATV
ncbi:MAG TPA: cyclic nucleotide-binding domain-containing protein, partial [candidate division WOR-3 bacterium]|nr:cyclic nucleotide-binding domain-containing protein [candidate division WOR-3 bacterium]